MDWALAALALTQNGVFRLTQAIDLGITARGVQKRTGRGSLHRIHHAVYGLTPVELLPPFGRRTAAVLACGDGAALSHYAAAKHLGLVNSNRARFDVTVPTHAGRLERPGIVVHRSTTLRPRDVIVSQGVPCTTWDRTLVDLADVITTDRRLERAIDRADELRLLDLNRLREQLGHNAGRLRAVTRVARVLAFHIPGSTATFNDFEERLFIVVRSHTDLPDPEVQQWLDLGDGLPMIRPDFMWRRFRLIAEADGFETHGTWRGFHSDYDRDLRIQAAGWRIVRVNWLQVARQPEAVGRALVAVAASTRLPLPAAA